MGRQPAWGMALVMAVVLVYMNSLSGPFIFDDLPGIIENPHIRSLWPLSDMLFHARPDSPPAGRPVVAMSLAINHAMGGLDVHGYHLFNVAVHLASVLVLWGVAGRTLLDTPLNKRFGRSAPFLAFAIALIWAIHPLQTEPVTYISQRTELLMGLFYLLTLCCAIRAWQPAGRRFWPVAAVIACAIGMGCKEAMVSAPLIVLLYDVTLVSSSLREALRRHWRLYVGLAATWGLLAWLNISAPRGQTCGPHLGISVLDYLRTQAAVIVWYLRLCFWPDALVISYADWPLARSFATILPQGLFILALLGLTVWALWRRHPAAILGAWFLMILAPTSSFVPIVTEIAAERRMHLPLAAVVVAVILGSHELGLLAVDRLAIPRRVVKVIGTVVLVLTAAALGHSAFMRNRDYRTDLAIWTDAVAKRPENWLAYNNRAFAYCRKGAYDEAIQDFTTAIELQPDTAEYYYNRGGTYNEKGDYARAILDCNEAIRLKPDSVAAYYNRGNAYGQRGDHAQAIQDYTKAIELAFGDQTRPSERSQKYADAYSNRAVAYFFLKQYDQAWADVRMCRSLGGRPPPAFVRALTAATGKTE